MQQRFSNAFTKLTEVMCVNGERNAYTDTSAKRLSWRLGWQVLLASRLTCSSLHRILFGVNNFTFILFWLSTFFTHFTENR